jgi:hypothetical protein
MHHTERVYPKLYFKLQQICSRNTKYTNINSSAMQLPKSNQHKKSTKPSPPFSLYPMYLIPDTQPDQECYYNLFFEQRILFELQFIISCYCLSNPINAAGYKNQAIPGNTSFNQKAFARMSSRTIIVHTCPFKITNQN